MPRRSRSPSPSSTSAGRARSQSPDSRRNKFFRMAAIFNKDQEALFHEMIKYYGKAARRSRTHATRTGGEQHPWTLDLDGLLMDRGDHKGEDGFNGIVSLIGCHGVAGFGTIIKNKDFWKFSPGTAEMQATIGRTAARDDSSFSIILGDNFYDDGIREKDSPRFQQCFDNIYTKLSMVILGNHDYKIHGGAVLANEVKGSVIARQLYHQSKMDFLRKIGRSIRTAVGASAPVEGDAGAQKTMERALRQVHYTYSQKGLKKGRDGKFKQWNMPYRYYALVSDIKKVVFFCIDSNTLPFDYSQQYWLETEYKYYAEHPSYSHYKRILCMHHPIISAGKRYKPPNQNGTLDDHDPGHYIRAFGIEDKVQAEASEMGQWNARTLNDIGANRFAYIFCAHDHLLIAEKILPRYQDQSLQTLPGATQIISGGGGAALSVYESSLNKVGRFKKGLSGEDAAVLRALEARQRPTSFEENYEVIGVEDAEPLAEDASTAAEPAEDALDEETKKFMRYNEMKRALETGHSHCKPFFNHGYFTVNVCTGEITVHTFQKVKEAKPNQTGYQSMGPGVAGVMPRQEHITRFEHKQQTFKLPDINPTDGSILPSITVTPAD